MADVKQKVWGHNIEIYANTTVSVNILRVEKGGTCSLHTHKTKHNLFYVISGELKLSVFPQDLRVLHAGDECRVVAGEEHRFQAIQDTVVVEVVFAELDSEDIHRKIVGYLEPSYNSNLWKRL